MRHFQPKAFGLNSEWFAEVIEARLSHSGEYVYHLPSDADKQAVVMNYQYLPVNETGDDYLVANTNPTLYGLIEHFETLPKVFKGGDSVQSPRGSQFEIRGVMYKVKKVDVNHRGYVQIELVQADNCSDPRPGFKDEMDDFLCSSVHD